MNASEKAATERVVWVDDAYDRDHASDGSSRYGAYLRDRAHRFRDGEIDDGVMLSDPREFAQTAFRIARWPIMNPGYVHTHRRVWHEINWYWDGEERLAVELALVAPRPVEVATMLGRQWRDWATHGWGEGRCWVRPYDNDEPAAWTTLTLRIPLDAAVLPAPAYHGPGRWPDVDTAKAAVAAVCEQINAHAGAVLAALEGGAGRDRER